MPRVRLMDPWGMCYEISTTRPDTLRAWFDEICPIVNSDMGKSDGVPPARIYVYPMWRPPTMKVADWLTDTRIISDLYEFPARDGTAAVYELERLRQKLQEKLEGIKRAQGR